MISIEDLESWVEKFDSEAEIDLLLDLLNNKIKIEYMLDSIVAYAQQDYENAKYFRKEMYRKNQEPYCHECKSLNVATHDQNGSPITDFANRNGYCFNCNDYAKIKGVAHDND